MAIDFENKRASAIGFDSIWAHLFPKPGTTINAQYRQQIGMKYAGDLGGAPAAATNIFRTLMGVGG